MAIRRALAISFVATYAAMIIAFVSSMIIARLLTPAEIGVYSVASALVAIVHQIRIFGVGNYLVQEPDLTHDRIRSAFGLLLLISWVLAVVVFGASFAAARLYDNPGVGSVMRVFALNFVLAPFGGIAMTLLLREMRFGARAVYELASAVVLAMTTVSLAYLGFSYMSLAWGSLAGLVTGMVIANFYRPRGLPRLPSFRELRHVAAFGGPSAAADLVASQGPGSITVKMKFEAPVSLLIEVQSQNPLVRRPEIRIHQFSTKPAAETVSNGAYQRRNNGLIYTTQKTYSRLAKVLVKGVDEGDTVVISTLDFTSQDHTLFMPLWAGVPDVQHAQMMIGRPCWMPAAFTARMGSPPVRSRLRASPKRNRYPWRSTRPGTCSSVKACCAMDFAPMLHGSWPIL